MRRPLAIHGRSHEVGTCRDIYPISSPLPFPTLHPFSHCRRLPSLPSLLHLLYSFSRTMSAAAYDLRGHFEFEQEAPPYVPNAPPPIYKPKSCVPHDHHLSTVGAGPDDARLSGFDLAESIWSQDSDLTLDDLALSFDSTSSRSSMSSHWSAPPLTPPTSRHLDLHPQLEPVALPTETPVQESEPEEPDSPAPAYSRDPLEFDPAILASLDSQLRLRPLEAFEDMCWACFSDAAPVQVAHSSQSQTVVTLSLNNSSMSCISFTADSAFSDTSTTTMLAPYHPPSPPPSPSQPPPAYLASKPLPSIPPSSPIRRHMA
ncbi:hypothetical protein F5888DRAFT_766245 [Russula emetica]|nr:hypothetical protein F5888DRAFT_766245 [Russula emetica]